jgi:hypothetical protein
MKRKTGKIVLRDIYAGPFWWGICKLADLLTKDPCKGYSARYVRDALAEVPRSHRQEVARAIGQRVKEKKDYLAKYPPLTT